MQIIYVCLGKCAHALLCHQREHGAGRGEFRIPTHPGQQDALTCGRDFVNGIYTYELI